MAKEITWVCLLALLLFGHACKECTADEERHNVVGQDVPPEFQHWFTRIPDHCNVTTNTGFTESYMISASHSFRNDLPGGDLKCALRKGVSHDFRYSSSLYGHYFSLSLDLHKEDLTITYRDENYSPDFICNTFTKNLFDKNSPGWSSILSDSNWSGTGYKPDVKLHDFLISNSDTFNEVYEIALFNYQKKNPVIIKTIWLAAQYGVVQMMTADSTLWYLDVK
jgi:hypothetical protein